MSPALAGSHPGRTLATYDAADADDVREFNPMKCPPLNDRGLRWQLLVCSWLVSVAAPLPIALAWQQDQPESEGEDVYEKVLQISDVVRQIGDWDNEYQYIEQAINNVWEQNNWTEEADEYARNLILEVSEIPPWEFPRRIQLVNQRVKERYEFTDAEAFQFQSMMWRETGTVLLKNSGIILKHAREIIETRTNGQPFTPEQIAEWTKESEPMVADIQERIARVSGQMREKLKPAQQAIFDRDLKSLSKRMNHYVEKRKDWVKGQWRPSDWGMQNDPIQRGERVQPFAPANGAKPSRIPRWLPHEPATWFAYVLHAEKRFGFDVSQREAAKSIHDELLERASAYTKSHAVELGAVPRDQRASHENYHTIRRQFAELKQRIGLLATRVQKDKTGS